MSETDTRHPTPETALLDSIEQLVSGRNSGFGLPADLTQLEKELVILWDQHVAGYERAYTVNMAQALEMLTMGGRRKEDG